MTGHHQTAAGLVCLDLDGTLLDRSGYISGRNRDSLLACLDRGIQVYFVTGRPYCFARSLADTADRRIGVIACSGACCECGGELTVHELPEEVVREFVNRLETSGCHAFFKGLTDFYTHDPYDARFLYDRHNSWFSEGLKVRSFPELSYQALKERAVHIHKILVYDMDRSRLTALAEQTERLAGAQVSWYRDISFDVTASGEDKGSAVERVRKYLGLERGQVLAIGDAWNDLSMFQSAGRRVAMGNAVEAVKRLCGEVTGTNEEDGVAQVLERLVQSTISK